MAPSGLARLLLSLGAWTRLAQAQIFKFSETPVPATFSLSTHYMFYVYAKEDAPHSPAGAAASVEFRQLQSKKSGTAEPPRGYGSVEVSLLPFDLFWTLVRKEQFCSSTEDVRTKKADELGRLMLAKPRGQSLREVDASVERVPFPASGGSVPKTVSYPIHKTGAYILTFTNCGNFSEATLTGSLAVRNAYGYLPANEFYTMRLFGWLTVVYVLIFAVSFGAMVRHHKALFYIQKGIASIALLCVLECAATWAEYRDWNENGERRDIFFVASLLLYTLKYVFSWRLILLSSLGAGVVLQDLDSKTSIIFFVASTLFMVQSCLWKLLISYRYSHALEIGFLMIVTMPGILIYTGMFMWTFFALSNLLVRIEDQKQDMLVKTFRRVQKVLIGGFALSTLVMLLQVVDISYGGIFSWEYQWFSADGAPQFAFMMVLTLMIWVWWPNEDSWKFGYMVQVDQNDDEIEVVDVGHSGENHGKSTSVVPEQIGADEDA